ncbi:hypothetical protein JI752_017085 [Lysobacter sp. MMG2]|nr:hypothetical protein [Lysobacter sp. MMG2]
MYKCVDAGGKASYQSAPCDGRIHEAARWDAVPEPPPRRSNCVRACLHANTTGRSRSSSHAAPAPRAPALRGTAVPPAALHRLRHAQPRAKRASRRWSAWASNARTTCLAGSTSRCARHVGECLPPAQARA